MRLMSHFDHRFFGYYFCYFQVLCAPISAYLTSVPQASITAIFCVFLYTLTHQPIMLLTLHQLSIRIAYFWIVRLHHVLDWVC